MSRARIRAGSALVLATIVAAGRAAPARADDGERAARQDRGGQVERSTEQSVASAPARAASEHWQAHWPRFHAFEGIATGVALAMAVGVYVAEPRRFAMWRGPAPGDDAVRSALRIGDGGARLTIQHASDAMLIGMMAWPIVVDATLLAGAVHGDSDAALQMGLIDLEVLAIAYLFTTLTSRLVGRLRPGAIECAARGDPSEPCPDPGIGPLASFVSGHALMSFASAGLVCAHHVNQPWLTGSDEGAGIACGSGMLLATAVSAMRLMGDSHYFTDVVVGAVLGGVIGFVLPVALHYPRGPRARTRREGTGTTGPALAVFPGGGRDDLTLQALGTF